MERLRANCDRTLYKQLDSLPEDPTKWSPPAKDPEEAREYRRKAEWYFELVTRRWR